MKIRNAIAVVGLTGTLIAAQLVGNAFADTTADSLTQAKNLLGSYQQFNEKMAACMGLQGLDYDATLMKSDVGDAFSVIPPEEMDKAARKQLTVQNNAAATEDPNDALMATMSAQEQEVWATAVNDCSAQIDFEASGGAEGRAKVEQARRAAAASPEVQAAAKTYVACMGAEGFAVDVDPFVPPAGISQGEHGTSAAEIALVEKYTKAWDACVQPWQETFDQKLFG